MERNVATVRVWVNYQKTRLNVLTAKVPRRENFGGHVTNATALASTQYVASASMGSDVLPVPNAKELADKSKIVILG